MAHTGALRSDRFSLGWALLLSALLHVVLALLLGWLPSPTPRRVRTPEESVLRFSFAPVQNALRDSVPKGQVPVPVPRSAPQPPATAGPPPAPVSRRSPPSPPVPSSPPLARPAPERPEGERVKPGVKLPGENGLPRGGPSGKELPEPGRPERFPRRLDLDRALREFNRAVSRPRPPSPDSAGGRRPHNRFNLQDLPSVPTIGYGFGNLEFESRDYDWSDYARMIYIAIWRAWHNRLLMTAEEFERWSHSRGQWHLQDWNGIRFTIERNGQVTGVAVETPSGCVPLDDSAVDALLEVILPPLPDDFPRDRETVHARFIADADVRTMRLYLQRMKAYGLF